MRANKRIFPGFSGIVTCAICLFFSLGASAQIKQTNQVPEGWSIMGLPLVAFNSDLGVQFGAFTDFYFYGRDPSIYPDFHQLIHIDASYYTKGQVNARLSYDAKTLIPWARLRSTLSLAISPVSSFYGFNGLESYDKSLDRENGQAVYCLDRKALKFNVQLQGKPIGHFSWAGGLTLSSCWLSDLNFSNYDPSTTIYRRYVDSGIIHPDEASGGTLLEMKGGVCWDSRDRESDPKKGIHAETFFYGAPDIFDCGYSYLKFSAHFRHYFTPFADWLTFAYHIAYQGKIVGSVPFYMQQDIISLSHDFRDFEGFGGHETVRGYLSKRLLGDGYAWANIEARFRVLKWQLKKQSWFIGINPFFDMGCITRPYRLEEMAEAYEKDLSALKRDAIKLRTSTGCGLIIGFDNSVFSMEFSKQLSGSGDPLLIDVSYGYAF